MSSSISNSIIDAKYAVAKEEGAIGGKILGSGGGGFMLVFAKPEDQLGIEAVTWWKRVPFEFEFEGSKVIYNG